MSRGSVTLMPPDTDVQKGKSQRSHSHASAQRNPKRGEGRDSHLPKQKAGEPTLGAHTSTFSQFPEKETPAHRGGVKLVKSDAGVKAPGVPGEQDAWGKPTSLGEGTPPTSSSWGFQSEIQTKSQLVQRVLSPVPEEICQTPTAHLLPGGTFFSRKGISNFSWGAEGCSPDLGPQCRGLSYQKREQGKADMWQTGG